MKKYIIGFLIGLAFIATSAQGLSTFLTAQGGTGTTTPSGILSGDNGATSHLNTVKIGSNLTWDGVTLSATGGGSTAYDWLQSSNTFGTNSLTPTTTIPINIKSAATSTFAGGLEAWRQISAPYFQATSTATSTIANGLTMGGTNFVFDNTTNFGGFGKTGYLSIGANPSLVQNATQRVQITSDSRQLGLLADSDTFLTMSYRSTNELDLYAEDAGVGVNPTISTEGGNTYSLNLTTHNAPTGGAGSINLTPANSGGGNGNGGDITLTAGNKTGSGTQGRLHLRSGGGTNYINLITGTLSTDQSATFFNGSGTICLSNVNCPATTTSNIWAGTQTFGNSSTTLATVNTLWLTPLAAPAGAFLAVDQNGKVISTTTPSGGSGTPGGSDTNVQYNSLGTFAGNSGFTYDGSSVVSFQKLQGDASNGLQIYTPNVAVDGLSSTDISIKPGDIIQAATSTANIGSMSIGGSGLGLPSGFSAFGGEIQIGNAGWDDPTQSFYGGDVQIFGATFTDGNGATSTGKNVILGGGSGAVNGMVGIQDPTFDLGKIGFLDMSLLTGNAIAKFPAGVSNTTDIFCFQTLANCGSGGSSFPFTQTSYGVSTTTTIGLLNGFLATASSTVNSTFHLPTLSNGGLAVYGGLVTSGATTTAGTGLAYLGNAFNCNTANGSTFGCLSAADWTTFNGKQATLIGTAGQTAYFSDTNTAVGTSTIFISTSGKVSIGTTTPSPNTQFQVGQIDLLTGGPSTFGGPATFGSTGSLSGVLSIASYGSNGTAGVNTYIARGTPNNPTATQNNDILFFLGGRGYGTSAWGNSSKASISMKAAQVFTDTNNGTYITFNTTPLNSTTVAEVMRMDSTGNLGIGTTTPGTLLSLGNTGSNTVNISATATSTFGSGLNIKTGCFSINDTCVGGSSFTNTIANGGTGSTSFSPNSIITSNAAGTALIATTSNITVTSIVATSTTATSTISNALTVGVGGNGYLLVAENGVAPAYPYLQEYVADLGGSRANDFISANIYNNSATGCATADLTAGNDASTALVGYTDIGITSSNWTGTGCAANQIAQTGTSYNSSYILNPNGGQMAFWLATTTPSAKFTWGFGGYASSNIFMTATNGGNLGIGTTTPYYPLTIASSSKSQLSLSDAIAGDMQFAFRNAGQNLYISTTTSAGTATTTIPALVIQGTTGNVGIGTTTPTSLLSIQKDNITTAATDGILLANTTLATVGVQNQYSPAIHLIGSGWKANATAAAIPTEWAIQNQTFGRPTSADNSLVFTSTRSGSVLGDIYFCSADTGQPTIGIFGLDGITNSRCDSGTGSAGFGSINATNVFAAYNNGSPEENFNVNGIGMGNTKQLMWFSGAAGTATAGDTSIVRNAAGVLEVNNGTSGTLAKLLTANQAVGTSTETRIANMTIGSSTNPQLSLVDNISGDAQWAFRNAGTNLYFATTTAQGLSTSTLSAFTILGSSGFVGIDNNVPTVALDVTGAIKASGSIRSDTFATNGATTFMTASGAVLQLGTSATWTNITFLDSLGEQMRISGQNIGMGTTTPSPLARLTIASSSGQQLMLSDATSGDAMWALRNAGGTLTFATTTASGSATTSTAALTLSATGKPGLSISSSTPFATLSVNPLPGDFSAEFAVGSSSRNDFYINNSGNIFAPNTTTNGAAQTGTWCYDANGQFVRDTAVCAVSDGRAKDIDGAFSSALNQISQLDIIRYHYKPAFNGKMQSDPNFNGEQLGMTAQNAQKVNPDLVSVYSADGNNGVFSFKKGEPSGLKTNALASLALAGVQELNKKVEALPQYAGQAKRSAEENWQWLAMALMLLWIIRLEIKTRK